MCLYIMNDFQQIDPEILKYFRLHQIHDVYEVSLLSCFTIKQDSLSKQRDGVVVRASTLQSVGVIPKD